MESIALLDCVHFGNRISGVGFGFVLDLHALDGFLVYFMRFGGGINMLLSGIAQK